jgi:hypothetical protein
MNRLFPRGTAWLSALALTVFAGLIGTTMSFFARVGASLWYDVPRIAAVAWIFAFLSPIFLIAFGSHLMHKVVDRLQKRKAPRGMMPGLMAWWTGLYGWLVLALASWTSVGVMMVIHPQSSLAGLFALFRVDASLASILSVPTIVFFLLAAFLFQVERAVRTKMAAAPDSTV